MIEKEEYLKAKKIIAEYEKQLNIHSVSKSFTPLIGEIVEVLYSEYNFNVGDKVEVYETHEEDGFFVVGNDDPNTYNESIHISNLKEIN